MFSKPLPRFVIVKTLASGAMGFYFNVPTLYRKLGCTIANEPLGTDYVAACGESGDGGRAAALNGLFDEWNTRHKGGAAETGRGIRYGTVDWLFREYLRSESCRERVSDRTRPDYERVMQLVADVVTKRGDKIGDRSIRSITPRAADKIYSIVINGPRGLRLRQGEKVISVCRHAWRVVHRLYPDLFDKAVPNPWQGVTKRRRTLKTKPAATRDEVYRFARGAIDAGLPEAAAAAVICFEWLQRPENVIAGYLRWPDYRPADAPHAIRIAHHKNGSVVWHPLEEALPDGSVVQFYPEAELVLASLPRRGVPMILQARCDGTSAPFSIMAMDKRVRKLRLALGLPSTFTLDSCRHGGMTELEEAELTDGQGRALSGHRTQRAYQGYAKRTLARALPATRKRYAHRLANVLGTEIQNAPLSDIQNSAEGDDAAIA
jgi:integrase